MLNDIHASLLANALNKLLGKAEEGNVAFIRCLNPEIVRSLCGSPKFHLKEWDCFGVIDEADPNNSAIIRSDMALAKREDKKGAVLFLVDEKKAGAGMDGIYNAGREISEKELFEAANKEALKRIPHGWGTFVKKTVTKARRLGGHTTISPWREFDFYSSCVDSEAISTALVKLGLWPIQFDQRPDIQDLDTSVLLVERLFMQGRSSLTPEMRVEALMLQEPTDQQKSALIDLVRQSAGIAISESIANLAMKPHLWVNVIRPFPSDALIKIEIVPWRNTNGTRRAWSGLEVDQDGRLQFILDPQAIGRSQSKLEVRWEGLPDTLAKGTVEYSIAIISGDEELAEKKVTHSGRSPQKCTFTLDDFELDEGAKFEALVRVRSIGNEEIEEFTEDFLLMFGEKPDTVKSSAGKIYRAIAEGAILIEKKEDFESAIRNERCFGRDSKGHVTFRFQADDSKICNAKMYCPELLRTIEEDWGSRGGAVGRWFVNVRSDGTPAGPPEFIPYEPTVGDNLSTNARKLAGFAAKSQGIVGMIHGFHDAEKDYLNAWQSELQSRAPDLALQNTLEVRTLSGDTVGIIVLPFHPLRLAWHWAYDQLIAWCRFEKDLSHKKILEVTSSLDGAHFPALLPGLRHGESFVFGDTLGFHAVAMVADSAKEPKANVAMLAKVLAGGKDEIAPSIGKTTSNILATEISRYLVLHDNYSLIAVHALRPGDGMTIGRALGESLRKLQTHNITDDEIEEKSPQEVSFSLELFPSEHHHQVCGRYFSSIVERKRSGAGSLPEEDRWMLEPCRRDGDVSVPKLSWAKRNNGEPISAAHLSVAFDTFDSRVVALPLEGLEPAPTEVFGLSINLIRLFSCNPQPLWFTYLSPDMKGKRHPAAEVITDRLSRLHSSIMSLTATNLGAPGGWPILQTRIDADKEDAIAVLHRLSDWVITIDRNAGIEYFDSPKEKTSVYDAYIIDCVPEREDLGFLQMVTSTSNFDEVHKLLDMTLTEIGLSASPRNCLFLLNELKALSGRFAMRLSGSGNHPQEMVALSMTHAVSRTISATDEQWLSLKEGFFVPIDDVPDLLGIESGASDDDKRRADLLYITVPKRGAGFQFTFVEVEFRRYLKTARSNDVLEAITKQLKSSRQKWEQLYGAETSTLEKAVRRSWLAHILRFYAAKGRRHYLNEETWQRISRELDKMVREGEAYPFPESSNQESSDRGFIFCPEYSSDSATRVSYQGQPEIYLFGANEMPDPPVRGVSRSNTDEHEEREPSIPEADTAGRHDVEDQQNVPMGEKIVQHNYVTPLYDEEAISTTNSIDISENKPDNAQTPISSEVPILLGVEPNSQEEMRWKISIKTNPHLMIVGLPGMGKTTSLITICLQMVRQGIAPIIFSYHDDIDEKLAGVLGNDLQYVDYAGLGFNPLQVVNDNPMAYIDNISMLRDIFASIFPDLGDIQLGRLREALKDSYIDKGWGDNGRDRTTLELPDFQAFYDYLKSTTKNDKADKGLLTRLDELNDYSFFSASAGIRSLLDTDKPAIIRIHKTQNEVLQKAFATFVLHNLYQQMFIRGVQQRISHSIIFDEAHRAAKLKLIPTMAKECRKFGIAFVLASQEAKDFDPSLFNAVANYLSLRLNETDAKVIAKIMANTDHVNRFTDRIKQMPKYHAFFFGEGRNKPVFVKLYSQGLEV
jgi:DNA phosphorothioation-dependent restriction protein DptH